jgi:predicted phage-related endonuclease
MPIERHPTKPGELHPLRERDITASVIGALFGLSPYETAAGLYAQKSGVQMPQPSSEVLRRGQVLEDAVANAARIDRPGWAIVEAAEYLRRDLVTMPDGSTRGIGATPDFYLTDERGRKGVLQAKTVAPSAFAREWTSETPPTWIALQTATEAMLAEVDIGWIGALVLDPFALPLHLYEVPRIPDAERRLVQAVTKFWEDFAQERPPRIDYERDARLMQVLYPREVPGKEVDLRGDNRVQELLIDREILMAEIKAREAAKAAAETELREKIGDAESAIVRGWRISLKEIVVKEHVRKESRSRRFYISRDREDAA